MTTSIQIIKKFKRKKTKYKTNRRSALGGSPQKIVKLIGNVREITPRKPNSAKRKIGRVLVRIKKGIYTRVFAYLPGEHKRVGQGIGQNLKPHEEIWIRGGRIKDLPGLKYRIMHGTRGVRLRGNQKKKGKKETFYLPDPLYYLRKKRSKYGVKKPQTEKQYRRSLKTRFKYY